MLPEVHSLFGVEGSNGSEVAAPLLAGGQFRLERIVSFVAASAPGFWYDQEWPEWVALVRGAAGLEFEQGTLELRVGDFLVIPEHLKHRVAWTSADAVWVALHFQPGAEELDDGHHQRPDL
jgi:cupin 2 domain-containing protein